MPVQVDNVGEEIQLTSQDEQFTTHVEGLMESHGNHEDAEFSDEPSSPCYRKFPNSKTLIGKI